MNMGENIMLNSVDAITAIFVFSLVRVASVILNMYNIALNLCNTPDLDMIFQNIFC